MKQQYLITLILSLVATPLLSAEEPQELTDKTDKRSYSIGYNIGGKLKQQEVDINLDLLSKGIKDAISGSENPLLSEQDRQEVLKAFQKEMFLKQAAKRQEEADKNLKAGEAFLAENAKKEGVKTLEDSGLQYKVITEGTGAKPKATDKVTTHYRGTLIDGTEFDSSYQRGNKPATFAVNKVIPGWTEALQLMKTGAKWQLFIPAKLAYGQRGAPGGKIGPNSALIFEIELLSIEGDKTNKGDEENKNN